MKRPILTAVNTILLTLTLLVVGATPAASQEKSHMVVRPPLLPDSLIGKHAVRAFDTTKVRQNWNKLKKGQTIAEVEKLLGYPPMVHIDGINGWSIWWYGTRSVAFNSVTNRVSHWDEILDH
jgi:hypothetical protein